MPTRLTFSRDGREGCIWVPSLIPRRSVVQRAGIKVGARGALASFRQAFGPKSRTDCDSIYCQRIDRDIEHEPLALHVVCEMESRNNHRTARHSFNNPIGLWAIPCSYR